MLSTLSLKVLLSPPDRLQGNFLGMCKGGDAAQLQRLMEMKVSCLQFRHLLVQKYKCLRIY
jgi:hypothetical protein